MKTVGLRELKKHLSAYIKRVRAGEAIMVTNRSQVVAEIRPLGQASPSMSVDPGIARWVNRSLLILGARNTERVYPSLSRLLRSATSSKLLEDGRASR